MPRLIVALIRHGDYQQRPDTPSAHQPFPLSPLGEQQARQAGVEIAEFAADLGLTLCPSLDCSSLLRAWQTAHILADSLPGNTDYTLHSTMALAERSVGIAANLTTADIESLLAQDPRCDTPPENWKSNSHYCLPLPGAESLMTAGQRVAQHLRQRTAEPVATDTLKVFVGHGAALRHAALGRLQRSTQVGDFRAKLTNDLLRHILVTSALVRDVLSAVGVVQRGQRLVVVVIGG